MPNSNPKGKPSAKDRLLKRLWYKSKGWLGVPKAPTGKRGDPEPPKKK